MQLTLSESNVFSYLQSCGLLSPGEEGTLSHAGEGNINWVRRVQTADGRSFVLKQARPALERFPEYRASTQRIVFEARYYETAASLDAFGVCPLIHRFDPIECVLVLEDLCDAERLDHALAGGVDVHRALRTLGSFLGAVHSGTGDRDLARHFENREMQRLHGDHVFQLPFRKNDFPLSPRLRECAAALWGDEALVRRVDAAYARFLEPVGALVHADVQPGNILLSTTGPKLLDAEISHVGDPAFDVGTLLAHLLLEAIARGDVGVGRSQAEELWSSYTATSAASRRVPFGHAARYAGIEMLRRTLGAARVAAVQDDDIALAVVESGRRLVNEPADDPAALLRGAR